LHTERDRAAAFDDDALDDRQRFERDYLLAGIDRILFWLEAYGRLHRLRGLRRDGGRADSREPAYAAPAHVHRPRGRGVRRVRGLLCRRRPPGLRRGG
jgi:hypothetical protein